MAIKTMVFQSNARDSQVQHVAREAAIASALVHTNIVATYSTEVCSADEDGQQVPPASIELSVYKFYLVQVRALCSAIPAELFYLTSHN